MHNIVGLVWNPAKTDADTLRSALDAALDASGGTAPGASGDAAPDTTGDTEPADGSGGRDGRPTVHWYETTRDDPGEKAAGAALADGCTLVIAAGGDGTVRSVATALGHADETATAELGIVPLGTGNLLARNLGIPLGNPRAAFDRILRGDAVPLDLGDVELTLPGGRTERHGFVVMVGFGIDARMIGETDDELKAKAGWLAYVESLGRAAAATEVVTVQIGLDDAPPKPADAHTLLVANCGMIQGGITLVPDAAPDDGELDLLVLRADGIASWLDTMRNMMWDNGLKRFLTKADRAESSASVEHLRARRVTVTLPEPHPFEVDGDHFAEVSAFTVSIHPGALRVR